MFDATKLPTVPCDPAKLGQDAPAEAEQQEFARAPDGTGFVPNVNAPHPLKGTR